MPTRLAQRERPANSSLPASDAGGFTLAELIVVLVIIAILMAVVFSAFAGTKRTAYHKEAVSAASAYADAIDAYMADNANQPPVIGSSAWPGGAAVTNGPVDALLQGKPYLRQVPPEPISDKVVGVGTPAGPAVSSQHAYIAYTTAGANYYLHVFTTKVGSMVPMVGGGQYDCMISNAATLPAGVIRC